MKILGFEIRRAEPAAPPPETRSNPLESPANSLDDLGVLSAMGLVEPSGTRRTPVTESGALGVAAVYACVFHIARIMAWLPAQVIQQTGPRSKQVVQDLPVAAMLRHRPNSYQSAHAFKLSLTAQALLWGNAYAEIQRDVRTGAPIGLYPVPAWKGGPELKAGKKVYRFGTVELPDEDVFHLMAPGFDGIRGLSPIRQHRMTVGMALEALAYGEQFYANGTKLAGALETDKKLSADAAQRLRDNWTSIYAGKANSGKVAVLEEGLKFNPFTMSMEDAEYIATRKFSATEIARIYGVPPHKIGDLERATFTNIEHQAIEAVNDCYMPWIDQFEQEAWLKLLSEREQAEGYSIKFNIRALLRGDMKAQAEALKIGREGGWYSPDDCRFYLDENPIEGPGGNEYIRPMNMVPLGTPATGPAPAASEGNPA